MVNDIVLAYVREAGTEGAEPLEEQLRARFKEKMFNFLRLHDCIISDKQMPMITEYFKDGTHRLREVKISEMYICDEADKDCTD